jgi:hypothetical protein
MEVIGLVTHIPSVYVKVSKYVDAIEAAMEKDAEAEGLRLKIKKKFSFFFKHITN